jgi:hypothetical protein
VAVALNYVQVFPDLAGQTVLGAALLSVLVFEVVAQPETVALLDPAAPPPTEPEELREAELTPLVGVPAVPRPADPGTDGP